MFEAVGQTTKATRLTKEFENGSGSSAKMEKKIDEALELNPKNFAANAIKGVLHFDRGEHELALERLEKAEERKPNNAEVKEALCVLYEKMGDDEASEQKYREAVALGVKAQNRKKMIKNVAAGAVGGIVGGLLGGVVPFLDE